MIQRALETDPCRCTLSSCEYGKTVFAKEMRKKKAREIEGEIKKCDMTRSEMLICLVKGGKM